MRAPHSARWPRLCQNRCNGECLITLGMDGGSPSALRAIYEEALAVTRRSGDRVNTAWSHNNLGSWALADNDLEAAHHHFEQARAILHEVGAPGPMSVCNLGWVQLRRGHRAAAHAAFTEALHLSELHQLRRDASYAILGLACIAAAEHQWNRGACLLGFADSELQRCGASWPEPERTYRQRLLSEVERGLGGEFERSYDSGRTGSRRDLVEFALGQR